MKLITAFTLLLVSSLATPDPHYPDEECGGESDTHYHLCTDALHTTQMPANNANTNNDKGSAYMEVENLQLLQDEAKEVLQHVVLHPLLPTPKEEAYDAISRDGVVRLDGVLSPQLADECLAEINRMLAYAIESKNPMTRASGFSGGLGTTENRWDMYLRHEGVVKQVLDYMLSRPGSGLKELFRQLFRGREAFFHELSSLIVDTGAPLQPIHPDSDYTDTSPLFLVFVALQDVTKDMGATLFLPGTNTKWGHARRNSFSFLTSREFRQATLKKGDCAVFDSRLLHAGGPNYSQPNKRRVLLYFTFRNPLFQFGRLQGDLDDHNGVPGSAGSKWADLNLKLTDKGVVVS